MPEITSAGKGADAVLRTGIVTGYCGICNRTFSSEDHLCPNVSAKDDGQVTLTVAADEQAEREGK